MLIDSEYLSDSVCVHIAFCWPLSSSLSSIDSSIRTVSLKEGEVVTLG
jgi:hypothetical protein